jgi:ATP-dependent DNA ligase
MEGFFDGEAQYRAGRRPTFKLSCLHEIKHDGFGVIARKTGNRVKLYSRPGNDLTYRFPLIRLAFFSKSLARQTGRG